LEEMPEGDTTLESAPGRRRLHVSLVPLVRPSCRERGTLTKFAALAIPDKVLTLLIGWCGIDVIGAECASFRLFRRPGRAERGRHQRHPAVLVSVGLSPLWVQKRTPCSRPRGPLRAKSGHRRGRPYNMGAVNRNALNHSLTVEQRKQIIAEAAEQRYVEFTGGETQYTSGTVHELNVDTPDIQREFYDFYRTPRGEFTPVGGSPELTTHPTLTSNVKFMNYYRRAGAC